MKKQIKTEFMKRIKKEMKMGGKEKKEILKLIEKHVEQYIDENPNIDYGGLVEQFGTPEEIKNAYYESIEKEIETKLQYKKQIVVIIVCIGIGISAIIWNHYHSLNRNIPAYTVEEIEELEK